MRGRKGDGREEEEETGEGFEEVRWFEGLRL